MRSRGRFAESPRCVRWSLSVWACWSVLGWLCGIAANQAAGFVVSLRMLATAGNCSINREPCPINPLCMPEVSSKHSVGPKEPSVHSALVGDG